jgi:hypothetical protein
MLINKNNEAKDVHYLNLILRKQYQGQTQYPHLNEPTKMILYLL